MARLCRESASSGPGRVSNFSRRATASLRAESASQIAFLFQTQQAEIVFGDGEFDEAIGAGLVEEGDGLDHELAGEREFVFLHEDEAFLAQEGSNAGMFGAEEFLIERAGLVEEREGPVEVVGASMGFGDAGIGECGIEVLFSHGFEGNGESLFGER